MRVHGSGCNNDAIRSNAGNRATALLGLRKEQHRLRLVEHYRFPSAYPISCFHALISRWQPLWSFIAWDYIALRTAQDARCHACNLKAGCCWLSR